MEPRYTLDDLMREAGIGRRTLRSYIARGALPRPKHRGPLPAYDEAFLLRLKAAVRLRREGVPIDDLAARLSATSPDEIAYLAGHGPPPEAVPAEDFSKRAAAPTGPERWERTCLYPGLELHVAVDAGEAAQRMARAIRRMFGPAEGEVTTEQPP